MHREHLLFGLRQPLQHQPVGADFHHPGAGSHPHITPLQAQARLFPVEGVGLGQQGLPLFDQFHHGRGTGQIGQFAGQFHSRGAAPHHRQPLQGTAGLGQLGQQLLEALHIAEAAEAEGVAIGPGDPEAVGGSPGGQHQAFPAEAAAPRGLDGAACQVDPLDPVLQPAHALTRQHLVVAGGDLPAAQFAAQQFVEQGKEEEALARLHQQHRRVVALLGDGQGRVETAEPAAHHDHRAGCSLGWLAVGVHGPTLPIPSHQG